MSMDHFPHRHQQLGHHDPGQSMQPIEVFLAVERHHELLDIAAEQRLVRRFPRRFVRRGA